MDIVQVGVTAGRERAQQIERRRRLGVGLQQAPGSGMRALGVELACR